MWVAVRRMQLLRREPLGGGRVAARDRGALRATGTKDALNPVWGAQGIVFDRQRSRQGDAPVYNLWAIQPDGTGLRRVTRLKIPSMATASCRWTSQLTAGACSPASPAPTRSWASRSIRRAARRGRSQRTSSRRSSATTSRPTARRSSGTPAAPTQCSRVPVLMAGTLARTSDTAGGGSSTIAHEPASSCSAAQFRWRSSLPKTSMNTSITVAPGSRATLSVQPASRRLSPKWFSCRRNASPS